MTKRIQKLILVAFVSTVAGVFLYSLMSYSYQAGWKAGWDQRAKIMEAGALGVRIKR